ncbi:hypothetical protein BH93_11570 [Rhodococcoides fascians A25f]|uniref:hypothetical protein n=1 Tax=Rhodococcoides fascians TaxID=1828 RepID=UPI00055E605B|nr:hypothetical protein [Rhodococcus fascians]QII05925.1 hypothetical protein BH93_11570 [Rhodococcus fascians A25f]
MRKIDTESSGNPHIAQQIVNGTGEAADPLIGTVNTGMSKNEVTTAIGDATNCAMRRTEQGRTRTR